MKHTTIEIISAWLKTRGLRLIPSDAAWGPHSLHARHIGDLAGTIEDAWCATPTHEIDPAKLEAAIAAARQS